MSHPRGGGVKSGVCHTKKKLPKCVSGHLRYTFFKVKNGAVPIFGPDFLYFAILGGRRKQIFGSELFKNGF